MDMQTVEHDTVATTAFEAHRSRLFGIAYRMLGSRAEAEDILQDAYLRWHQSARDAIRNPEAWLVTAVTRLSIDRLRALRTEREAYHGPWLPEPFIGEAPPPPDRRVELASDVSLAFLLLLERLAPEERAAFLLHDVFDCSYADIAATLDKSEAACRQMVHRARERIRSDRKRFDVTEGERAAMVRRFIQAVEAADERQLLALLAPDASWTSDGGGRAPAAPRPILGAPAIVRLVLGLGRKFGRVGFTFQPGEVNGQTGLLVKDGNRLVVALAFTTDGERIAAVHAVVNPDKLRSNGEAALDARP